MKYIITKESGVHCGSCVLGSGDTKAEALEDAFGPKPWSSYQKKSARDACVREVTDEEADELVYG